MCFPRKSSRAFPGRTKATALSPQRGKPAFPGARSKELALHGPGATAGRAVATSTRSSGSARQPGPARQPTCSSQMLVAWPLSFGKPSGDHRILRWVEEDLKSLSLSLGLCCTIANPSEHKEPAVPTSASPCFPIENASVGPGPYLCPAREPSASVLPAAAVGFWQQGLTSFLRLHV